MTTTMMIMENESGFWKLFYTVLVYAGQFTYGLTQIQVRSNLVDYRYIYDTPFEQISYLTTFYSLGFLFGTMIGWLYRWLNRQLVLAAVFAVMTITAYLMPFYRYVELFFTAVVLFGFGCGTWDASQSVWIVEMWPRTNARMLQSMHFMFGVGAIISPLIASPFVHGETDDFNTVSVAERKASLAIPFAIVASIHALVTITFIIGYRIHPYRCGNSSPPPEAVSTVTNDPVKVTIIRWRWAKVILVGLCLATVATAENVCYSYIASLWQYMEIGMDASESARVLATFSALFTVGRLSNAIITVKLKPDLVISYHYLLIFGSLILTYFGRHHRLLVYIGNGCLGYAFSPMWPGLYSFCQHHLRLSDRISSFFTSLYAICFISAPFLLSHLFQTKPAIFFVVVGGFTAVSLLLFVLVNLWIRVPKKTYS